MVQEQHFIETPENVQISYETSGLGKRFVALVTDYLMMFLIGFVVFIVYVVISIFVGDFIVDYFDRKGYFDAIMETPEYLTGVIILVLGFGSFFYFFVFELFMKGQTPGKRNLKIRVIKSNGFVLDGMSILIRNMFRIVDNPMTGLWLVALFTKGNRRVGDLVGGTMVVDETQAELSKVRQQLSEQTMVDSEFSFDYARLDKLSTEDFQKLEMLLERLDSAKAGTKSTLLRQVVTSLSEKMNMPPPADVKDQKFLEDLLAAEYRRQNRRLG